MDTGHPLTASLSQTIVMRSPAANGRFTHVSVRPIGTIVRLIGAVCAVALLVGCSGSTSIRPFGGAYHLISVDGEPDPQPLSPGTMTPELVGGTLDVGADTLTVTLSLQPVDSTGRATGAVSSELSEIPYVRRSDSLFYAMDTLAFDDSLLLGGPPKPFGAIVGSNVRVLLVVPGSSSTGFFARARQFLFFPAW